MDVFSGLTRASLELDVFSRLAISTSALAASTSLDLTLSALDESSVFTKGVTDSVLSEGTGDAVLTLLAFVSMPLMTDCTAT